MARVVLEDVGGSFARFLREAPKVLRQELVYAVNETAQGVDQSMRSKAPVGPDAPHIADDIETLRARATKKSVTARVGYFGNGSDDSDQEHIALYNEYKPNTQPFMRPAAEDNAAEFVGSIKDALGRMENGLSRSIPVPVSGGGGSGLD
jgi:hypothetical protein